MTAPALGVRAHGCIGPQSKLSSTRSIRSFAARHRFSSQSLPLPTVVLTGEAACTTRQMAGCLLLCLASLALLLDRIDGNGVDLRQWHRLPIADMNDGLSTVDTLLKVFDAPFCHVAPHFPNPLPETISHVVVQLLLHGRDLVAGGKDGI